MIKKYLLILFTILSALALGACGNGGGGGGGGGASTNTNCVLGTSTLNNCTLN